MTDGAPAAEATRRDAVRVIAGCVLLAATAWGLSTVGRPTVAVIRITPGPVLLSLGAAVLFTAAVTLWISWGELSIRPVAAVLIGGGLGAVALSSFAENALAADAAGTTPLDYGWSVALVAGPVEELSKLGAVVLAVILFRDVRRRPLAVMALGAIAGTAFQASENHLDALYAAVTTDGDPTRAVITAWFVRTGQLGVWLHPADAAVAAAGLAAWVSRPPESRDRRVTVGLVLLAIALHIYWDAPFLRAPGVGTLLIGDIPRAASGLLALLLVYRALRRWPVREDAARAAT